MSSPCSSVLGSSQNYFPVLWSVTFPSSSEGRSISGASFWQCWVCPGMILVMNWSKNVPTSAADALSSSSISSIAFNNGVPNSTYAWRWSLIIVFMIRLRIVVAERRPGHAPKPLSFLKRPQFPRPSWTRQRKLIPMKRHLLFYRIFWISPAEGMPTPEWDSFPPFLNWRGPQNVRCRDPTPLRGGNGWREDLGD